jgi:cytosine/adenosine deaminase-related metal-dependent hydrolase
MALVVHGKVVTFEDELGVLDDADIYIAEAASGRNALIEAVIPRGGGQPPAGYSQAPRVDTDGVIYPGLIDLHNHLAYNYRSLWFAPRAEPYTSRDQWPRAANYSAEITRPTVALGTAAAKAALKFAEVKAGVGGVTSIQGSPATTRPYEGWLLRNIELETFGTGEDVIYQSVMNLDVEGLTTYAKHMDEGRAFIYHLAEGTNPNLVREFEDLETAGCVGPLLIGIHTTALGPEEYERWAAVGGAVVWSPFSNLWLYRDTTDVVEAANAGLTVCLGSDWGPSGTKNVLGELKVAHLWNATHMDRSLSDEQLCRMVTANPGDALGRAWGDRIGRIRPGLQADLTVTNQRTDDPYENLIHCSERHVRLVMVGGRPFYGNRSLMMAAGATDLEPIHVAGIERAISMLDPNIKDADVTWVDVVSQIRAVLAQPAEAVERALSATARGEPALRFIPDMPGGEIARDLASARDLGPVAMPELDTLAHDEQFFEQLTAERAPILGGLLDGLRSYFD